MNSLVFGYGFITGMALVIIILGVFILPQVQENTAYIEKMKEMRR
jgi:hypothetical protein